jgi:hypothetical protein
MNITSEIRRMSRAAVVSSAIAAAVYLAGAVAIDVWYRRTARLFGAMSGAIFLALLVTAAGIVQWPILRSIRALDRRLVVLTGAILAAVPSAAIIALFRTPGEDPATVLDFLRFWLRVPGEFLVPFVPMAIAGAMLAWFATAGQEPVAR